MRVPSLPGVVLLLVVASGCESGAPPAVNAASHVTPAAPRRAVLITGNGGSTTIFLPSDEPGNPLMLCTAGAEACPECKAAAVRYFETGALEPKCPRCGATRTLLVPSAPNIGHQ